MYFFIIPNIITVIIPLPVLAGTSLFETVKRYQGGFRSLSRDYLENMNGNTNCTFCFNETSMNRKYLFEEAVKYAKFGKVLYVLQEQLSELPQLSQDLTSVSKLYMKMISFLYARNLESLIESMSSLNSWKNIPSTIIVDSLNEYCHKDKLQDACGIVALLIDTARSCSMTLKVPCRLYISVDKLSVDEQYCKVLKDLYCTRSVCIE